MNKLRQNRFQNLDIRHRCNPFLFEVGNKTEEYKKTPYKSSKPFADRVKVRKQSNENIHMIKIWELAEECVQFTALKLRKQKMTSIRWTYPVLEILMTSLISNLKNKGY
jgi:hypothetical protein